MLNTKDYTAVAEIIKNQQCTDTPRSADDQIAKLCINNTLVIVARSIADYCGKQNPKFDRERFLKACGVEQ